MLAKIRQAINPIVFYVAAKGSVLILSLGFSIVYSRFLGLENRSVLTFIFTISSLLILGFTSSLGLSFRKSHLKLGSNDAAIQTYIKSLIFLTIILSIVFMIALFVYSNFVVHLNVTLFVFCFLLFVTSSFMQGLNELLIGLDRLRTISIYENIEVLTQFLLFFIFANLIGLSFIVAVMTSISLSYCLSSLAIVKLNLPQTAFSPRKIASLLLSDFRSVKLFDLESLYATLPLIVMDRLDKMIIGFFLPLVALSKYSILLVFFSLLRFIPDAVSKTYFSRHSRNITSFGSVLKLRIPLTIAVFLASYPVYVVATRSLLNKDWLLPLDIFIATLVFEISRSIYHLRINRQFAFGRTKPNFKRGLFFGGPAILFTLLSIHSFGLIGVPISFGSAYIVAILADIYHCNKQSSGGR